MSLEKKLKNKGIIPIWEYERAMHKVSGLEPEVVEAVLSKIRQEFGILRKSVPSRKEKDFVTRADIVRANSRWDEDLYLPPRKVRSSITSIIQKAAKRRDISPAKLFIHLYNEFFVRYGIDVNTLRKEHSTTGYVIIQKHNHMSQLYELAVELFDEK